MGFKENKDGKMICRCDRCPVEFQYGPHVYRGKLGPNDTMLCMNCYHDYAEASGIIDFTWRSKG